MRKLNHKSETVRISFLFVKERVEMDIRLPACRNRVKVGKNGYPIVHEIKNITITPKILKLVADIDQFKGRWKAMQTLAPERLTSLKRVATIKSIGSSTRIEGAKLTDRASGEAAIGNEIQIFRQP